MSRARSMLLSEFSAIDGEIGRGFEVEYPLHIYCAITVPAAWPPVSGRGDERPCLGGRRSLVWTIDWIHGRWVRIPQRCCLATYHAGSSQASALPHSVDWTTASGGLPRASGEISLDGLDHKPRSNRDR